MDGMIAHPKTDLNGNLGYIHHDLFSLTEIHVDQTLIPIPYLIPSRYTQRRLNPVMIDAKDWVDEQKVTRGTRVNWVNYKGRSTDQHRFIYPTEIWCKGIKLTLLILPHSYSNKSNLI